MKDSKFLQNKLEEINEEINAIQEECHKKILLLEERKNNIKEINIHNREESGKAIAYLVSQIEKEPYTYTKNYMELYHKRENKKISYVIFYLVKNGYEQRAKEEIESLFSKVSEMSLFSTDYSHSSSINGIYNLNNDEFLDFPRNNYLQLSYYRMPDSYPIPFNYYRVIDQIVYRKDHGLNRSSHQVNNISVGISNICDESFNYIVDFIDKVSEYKLETLNFNPSEEEMKKIADQFASSYQSNKQIIYKK